MVKKPLSIVILSLLPLFTFSFTADAQSSDGGPGADGIYNDFKDLSELTLLPDSPFTDEVYRYLNELDSNLGIEALFSIPRDDFSWDEQHLSIFRILQSVSTMEGIEYYSASREQMRIFYIESYTIRSAHDRNRIPDPLVSIVPERDELFAFQRDSSFGRNVQHLIYYADGDAFLVQIENETRMFYSLIPLVGPHNLRISILIQPYDEGILFYGNLGVRVPGTFGMEEKARNSFRNRIIALYSWFSSQLTTF